MWTWGRPRRSPVGGTWSARSVYRAVEACISHPVREEMLVGRTSYSRVTLHVPAFAESGLRAWAPGCVICFRVRCIVRSRRSSRSPDGMRVTA